MNFQVTHQTYNASSAWTHACIKCDDVDIQYIITFDCIDGAHYVSATLEQSGQWVGQTDDFISQYMPA